MNHHYQDITDKLGAPKWWDENAVPRYCEFHPDARARVYANEVVFIEIHCQNCGTPFYVAMSRGKLDILIGNRQSLADEIVKRTIHFGDPPNSGCCPAGPTMNSIPIKVLQYWRRDNLEWHRDSTFEIEIECD